MNHKEIDDILRISCLIEMITELPRGLDTVIGERGFTLSGGQKARVAIARALLLDPAILILDEPNAMLEDKLEAELWKNLVSERLQRTTIILTHHTAHIPKIYKSFLIEHGMVTAAHGSLPAETESRRLGGTSIQ